MANRKPILFLLFLFVSIGIFIAVRVSEKRAQLEEVSVPMLRVGDSLPQFKAKSTSGAEFSNESIKGKVVLLNFWATWCPPCIEEIPSLVKTYEELSPKGFEILAFGIDANGEKIIQDFMKKYKINYPVILDTDQKLSKSFSVLGVPENIIVGADGKILEKRYGADDWTSPAIREKLNKYTRHE